MTLGTQRSILFVGRTTQSSARLFYDVMPLLLDDDRIQIFYTVDPTTMFSDRFPEFLQSHHVKLVPWESAVSGKFHCDVTVTASAHETLQQLPGKKFVMGHGAGHHKYRATVDGFEEVEAGLSPNQLLSEGRVHPSVIALAGREQLDRLRLRTPQAADHAVVTGDVCAERLHLSLPHRHRYRHHLGLRPGQRLITLTSTWGPHSLIARRSNLAIRLLSRLPADEYRVALILHPNCWDWHGEPNVTGLLRTARAAGLILVEPHEGWRATVIASDCVVGDHGSVGLFAADIGRPLLYGAFGDVEVPPGSPGAELRALVSDLDDEADLRVQLDQAVERHDPSAARAITSTVLEPDHAPAATTFRLLYRLLELEPPGEAPTPEPFPLPEVRYREPTAWFVFPDQGDRLRSTRHPVTPLSDRLSYPDRARVRVVDAAEPDRQHFYSASVLTWSEPSCLADAQEWARTQLTVFPGAEVAVARLLDSRAFVKARRHGEYLASSTSVVQLAELGAAVYHHGEPPRTLATFDGSRPATINLAAEPHPD
ncbi:hypothetical protein ACFQ3B_00060 [Stackebrandtia endophytica]|uniref:hypothetical protein n=1 Tax=Stackebrandtia endophytica TaxID=1496996 RepID=UPI00115020E8|nr:hypothetical protein [Stackebrandtia endophytica]